jgi:hypothetical protein
MIKQNWIISDSEKNRILTLHETATKKMYLISEQENPNSFSIDFENAFESGKYKFNPNYQKIVTDKVQEIFNYIKNNKLKNYKIVITPSESQVPNQSPFQEPKSLAKARGEYLKTQLEALLTPLLNFKPIIEVNPPILGNVEWDEKKGKNHPDYKKDQFVKASVVITSNTQEPSYNRESDLGDSVFINVGFSKYLVGYIKEPFVKTTDIKDSGFQDIGHQDLIFTEVKKDTVPTQIVGKYVVPWEWWNKERDLPTTKHISEKDLEKIRTFPKA